MVLVGFYNSSNRVPGVTGMVIFKGNKAIYYFVVCINIGFNLYNYFYVLVLPANDEEALSEISIS